MPFFLLQGKKQKQKMQEKNKQEGEYNPITDERDLNLILEKEIVAKNTEPQRSPYVCNICTQGFCQKGVSYPTSTEYQAYTVSKLADTKRNSQTQKEEQWNSWSRFNVAPITYMCLVLYPFVKLTDWLEERYERKEEERKRKTRKVRDMKKVRTEEMCKNRTVERSMEEWRRKLKEQDERRERLGQNEALKVKSEKANKSNGGWEIDGGDGDERDWRYQRYEEMVGKSESDAKEKSG
ncbi:hypothetical protein BDZ45DRAFT_770214 [Acephala macrosclerotiorum]|nr:hypothetical protein BDZ45DRAFT_770214 [Acephala macrosclerotiorum]